jgi:hypothetical protein
MGSARDDRLVSIASSGDGEPLAVFIEASRTPPNVRFRTMKRSRQGRAVSPLRL